MKKLLCFAAVFCFILICMSGCSDSGKKSSSASANNNAAATPSAEEIPDAKIEEIGKKIEADFKTDPANVTLQFIDTRIKYSPLSRKIRITKNSVKKIKTTWRKFLSRKISASRWPRRWHRSSSK